MAATRRVWRRDRRASIAIPGPAEFVSSSELSRAPTCGDGGDVGAARRARAQFLALCVLTFLAPAGSFDAKTPAQAKGEALLQELRGLGELQNSFVEFLGVDADARFIVAHERDDEEDDEDGDSDDSYGRRRRSSSRSRAPTCTRTRR